MTRGTVLVTGSGMVGAYTARRLLDEGWQVTLLDRAVPHDYLKAVLVDRAFDTLEVDLTDQEAVGAALRGMRIDAVVHTAALVALRAQRDLVETLEVNVAVPVRLAAWAREAGARRFVALGSWSVYDERQDGPITEHSPVATRFRSYYVAAKLAMEHLLCAYAQDSGLEVVVLRPAVIYGYGPNLGGSVGSATIEEQVLRALRREPAAIPSTVFSTTELVYVEDVAAAAASAVSAPLPTAYECFTCGSQETTTAEQLAETIAAVIPGATVSVSADVVSSVVPPTQIHPTDTRKAVAQLRVPTPLRRREGFRRFVEEVRAAEEKGALP